MLWLAAGAGTLSAQKPVAPSSGRLPLDPAVTVGKLPNGLRYYIRVNHRPEKRAELRLVVNAGSVLEDDDQRGLAHFVEHMAFNGTTRFKKQELVDYLERIGMRFGADLNASTSFDETVYELQVPTDSAHLLDKGIQILEDWARGVTFDTAEVRKERGVVIEEWRLGQGAGSRVLNKQLPVIFRGSRYAERLPIGTKESLETFDRKDLVRFYHDWYRPDLQAVVAVGDFDPKVVERLIRQYFGRIPAAVHAKPRPAYGVPPRDSIAVAIATDPELTQTTASIYLMRQGVPKGTLAEYRRSLVADLYARMLNARLSEITQRPNPPFLAAGAGQSTLARSKEVFSLGELVSDTGLARGFQAVLVEVERVDRHGFTKPELERAKREVLRGYEQAYAERDKTESASLVGEYVENFLTGAPAPGIAYEFDLVKQLVPGVTLEELERYARTWLGSKDRVVLVSAPAKPEVRVPPEQDFIAAFDKAKRTDVAAYNETVSDAPLVSERLARKPIVSETRDTAIGVTRWTLANGARVIVKPTDFKADQVILYGFSPGGTSLAPDSLYTAASFAAQIANVNGLGPFSAVVLEKKLAGIAVQIAPFIATYQEGIRGNASPKDLETLFQLAFLQFQPPRPDDSAFTAFKQNIRAAIANRGASPEAAFGDTVRAVLAQHHPRARPLTQAIVDSLDQAQALAVYRDRFADASDFTFILVGSFTLDAVRPLVETYLANLPAISRTEAPRDVGLTPPTGVVLREVRKGTEPKASVSLTFTGPFEYTREERQAFRVLTDVLTIRFREQLREEQGGTYGVSVSGAPQKIPRPQYSLSVDFGAAPARVDQLVALVFAQIDSIDAKGPTEAELAKVREQIIRGRETELKENGFWLGLLLSAEQNGDEPASLVGTAGVLRQATVERIRDAARKYLRKDNYVLVKLMPEK
ncbi:MAG: insulinase family protein [Gemmatimonadota bacterium]